MVHEHKQPLDSLVPCGTRAKKLVFRRELESRVTRPQLQVCTAAPCEHRTITRVCEGEGRRPDERCEKTGWSWAGMRKRLSFTGERDGEKALCRGQGSTGEGLM